MTRRHLFTTAAGAAIASVCPASLAPDLGVFAKMKEPLKLSSFDCITVFEVECDHADDLNHMQHAENFAQLHGCRVWCCAQPGERTLLSFWFMAAATDFADARQPFAYSPTITRITL